MSANKTMDDILQKVKKNSGETITEVLVALLVAVLGILMVTGVIVSSTNSMKNAEAVMEDYYEKINSLETNIVDDDNGKTAYVTLETENGSRIKINNLKEPMGISINKAYFGDDNKTDATYSYSPNN